MTPEAAPPAPVADHRDELAGRLREGDGLFVGLDFDGTLAPIAEDPGVPTVTPACRRALSALVDRPSVTVAVVSGRALDDVEVRVGVPGVVSAGNHGLEWDGDGTRRVDPVARRRQPALRRTVGALRARLSGVAGCTVEDKGLTATVHYRRSPREAVDRIEATVREVVSGTAGEELSVSPGKESLEIRPAVDADKGTALRRLLDRRGGDPAVVYVGDDETDEDAFRALGDRGVGILVGDREGSAADYRVDDQGEVAPLLRWLGTAVAPPA